MLGNVHGQNHYDIRNRSTRPKVTKFVDETARSSRHNYGMRNKWLKDRIKSLGKTQAELARVLKLPTPRVSEMISGVRRIPSHEVPQIARFLDWPESKVLQLIAESSGAAFVPNAEPAEMPVLPVRVVGEVQAGVFRETLELPPDEQFDIYTIADPRFKGLPHFALRVRGPSMNLVYPEGSFVVCVPLIHLGEGFMPHSGMRVVVERRNEIGEVEATIKELVFDEGGRPWLWPRSNDPQFHEPWPMPMGTHDGGDHMDIRVSAVVVFSAKPEAW